MRKKRLYYLYGIDTSFVFEDKIEDILQPFLIEGFKLFNLLIFTSDVEIETIHNHIRKKTDNSFLFFLSDMTENMDKKSFKGYLNQDSYRYTPELTKVLNSFRPEEVSVSSTEQKVQKFHSLLDKISEKGIEKLTKDEKKFLDDCSAEGLQW